jgi:hypothetical protein
MSLNEEVGLVFGMRCEECGEVRWSIVARGPMLDDVVCPACGAAMIAERRYPGHQPAKARRERRDLVVLGPRVKPG